MTNKVAVVDYGIGNVFSVCNALRQIGADVELTRDEAKLMAADRIILPGVGAFARAMEALDTFGLAEVLANYRDSERPFLGICIGMQVLMESSDEFGNHKGMGFFEGKVERINTEIQPSLRVPHISWAGLHPSPSTDTASWRETPLAEFTPGHENVYYVHSYHCRPSNPEDILAISQYGKVDVCAALNKGSLYGVQFHPERSGLIGQKFLKGFMGL